MPSKAALHAGHQWANLRALLREEAGTPEGAVTANELWWRARDMRDLLAGNAAQRTRSAAGERLIMGSARFTGPQTLDVEGRQIRARAFIVATGSRPIVPRVLAPLGNRLLSTDTLFDLDCLPSSVGLLGLGAIGLEMGLALARLGVRLIACDMKALPAGISDPQVGARANERFGEELTMWLGQPLEARLSGRAVELHGGGNTAQVEVVLAALGRQANVDGLALDLSGAELDSRGLPAVDPKTLRVAATSVFLAGDIRGIRPLMYEAADEGVMAARAAAQSLEGGDLALAPRRTPLAIVFTDPDIVSVGVPYDKLDHAAPVIGTAQGSANGRSRVMGAAAIWCGCMPSDPVEDLLTLPYYHPTIEEMVQSALQDAAHQLKENP